MCSNFPVPSRYIYLTLRISIPGMVCIFLTVFWTHLLPFPLNNRRGFPGSSPGKESACNTGDPSLIPGLGRSPGGGHGNPLQYPCLENPMDRGDWQATIHRVGHDWSDLARMNIDINILLSFAIWTARPSDDGASVPSVGAEGCETWEPGGLFAPCAPENWAT